LIAGGLLTCIAVLKSTGWIDLDWTAVEVQVSHGIAAIHQGVDGLRQLLSGYLPSAGAAAIGLFFGFRRK
jgi:hypothetical protein